MRIYKKNENPVLDKILCNRCGKELKLADGFLREGCLSVSQQFGYFSRKDGETHRFDLCEECYDELISGFVIPVEIKETEELV